MSVKRQGEMDVSSHPKEKREGKKNRASPNLKSGDEKEVCTEVREEREK